MELCNIMSRLPRLMQGYMNDKITEQGLSSMMMPYLGELSKNDGIGMLELSRILSIDKANSSRVINQLEKLGLVRKEISSEDKRVTKLFLTDEGKAKNKIIGDALESWVKRLSKGITAEEFEILDRVMKKVYENAKQSRIIMD